jgi:hypothetical protein
MSNNNGLSYTQVVERMEAFANGHQMINAFQHGLIDLIDVPKDQQYPVMHFVPGSMQPTQGGLLHQFDVVFYDLPRAKEVENEYQREVISDMARLALDLVSEIKNGNVLFDTSVDVDGEPTITPFIESYAQVVTGVTLSMALVVPYNWNACTIPATYSPGGSGSGGSGSGSGAITLKVNGTNNAVQNVLNLVNGNNVTITDLGAGNVRIAATGGGGGGVDWGAIGGDIEDQADLIALLLGYATDAELTAEATTRASADTTLQNNINTVAGDLSTETTARMAGDATNATDISNVNNALTAHTGNTSNPHATTKAQVGLGNADDTSDLNKPISTATQTALDAKEPTITAGTTSQYYRGDKTFQTLDKSAVGLGNVDNTSDANKPVSTAQATAIALKQDTLVSGTNIKTINSLSILGSGNLVISAAVNQAFRTLGTAITLSGSSGDRFYVMQSGGNSGVEAVTQMSAEFAMTFTEIRVRTTGTQSATGTLVFTLRKNGADQFSLTIAAGAVAGVYTATGSLSVVAGDLINWKIRNNATVTSANVVQYSATYQ